VKWDLVGNHNVENALAAIAAAQHAGVEPQVAMAALTSFKNVKRRLEVKGKINGITVYDDFAHHPTAIATTLAGLRARIGKARIVAVVEFGSYTMRSGVHQARFLEAFVDADVVICKRPLSDQWDIEEVLRPFTQPTQVYDDVDILVQNVTPALKMGDHVIIMSNSGFNGIHSKLLHALEASAVSIENIRG
jgi:UDP-N-acetylmuramate: L-alanyl-gamma-D-glutamyl-meso-diaminopimelate ligase